MVPSDSELIDACRRGQADAWEILVLRYQRLIYTIPLRAGLDEEQAADVFQHVFAKLVQYLTQLDQPDRVRSWLVTTAKRETLHLLRRQATAATQLSTSDVEVQELRDDLPLPLDVVQKLEDQHLVQTALQQLEEQCRKLLALLFYQEASPSYADVAAVLGVSTGSIGPTRARLLKKLRTLLSESGF